MVFHKNRQFAKILTYALFIPTRSITVLSMKYFRQTRKFGLPLISNEWNQMYLNRMCNVPNTQRLSFDQHHTIEKASVTVIDVIYEGSLLGYDNRPEDGGSKNF